VRAITHLSQETDGFEFPGSRPLPSGLRSPSPSENLASHPYFKSEFTLPDDPVIEDIISRRRMRASVSTASTTPSPAREKPVASTRTSKRTKNKTKMAGLIGGDSDSSALTQESGDESAAPTAATATDAATEYGDGDEQSAGMGLFSCTNLIPY
jgi:MRG-binding protein